MNTDFDILRDITQEVCKADPMKETRQREVVYARMIMYKVLHSFHKHTYTRIGRMFGKNHATVLHSINQFDNMVRNDDWLNNRFHCVLSEYTKEISLQNEAIADVYLKNKILESKLKAHLRDFCVLCGMLVWLEGRNELKTTEKTYLFKCFLHILI
jgi:hypothetical protein